MQDFCPLCLKSGTKNRIKLLQINMQEAVWACESDKCLWPFGYEDFEFFPRKVGRIWSCYWDDYPPRSQKLKENITDTTELSKSRLDSIGSKNISDRDTLDLDISQVQNVDQTSNVDQINIAAKDSQNINDSIFSKAEKCVIKHHTHPDDGPLLGRCDTELSENIIKSRSEDLQVNVVTNKNRVSSDQEKSNGNNQSIQNAGNCNTTSTRAVPQIMSIEKTNIDITNVLIDSQASINQRIDKGGSTGTALKNKLQQKVPLTASNDTSEKPNLNVATMEVDGIPITLSYQIPTCEQVNNSTVPHLQQNNTNGNMIPALLVATTKVNAVHHKNVQPIARNLSSGKQYKKFSFSAIKTKLEVKDETKKPEGAKKNKSFSSNDANCANAKPTVISVGSDLPVCAISNTSVLNDSNVSQANTSVDNSVVNNNESIDTVLEDLLTKDYSISEHISDDWLNSLLT